MNLHHQRNGSWPASRMLLCGAASLLPLCSWSAAHAQAAGGDRAAQSTGASHAVRPVPLRSATIRPDAGSNLLVSKSPFSRGGRYVIQLDGALTAERAATLRAAGLRLGDYLSANSFIARSDGADVTAVAAMPFVRWVGAYLAAWKKDARIGRRAWKTAERQALASAGRVRAVVWSFDDVTPPELAAGLRGVKVQADGVWLSGRHTVAVIDAAATQIDAVAGLAGVQFIEEAPEFEPRNDTTTWIVQSNVAGSIPLWDNGLHGENQIGGLIDTTVDMAHCDFSDTNPIGPSHRKVVGYHAAAPSGFGPSHGTHVAGTFVGDGAPTGGNPCVDGMAFKARMTFRVLDEIYFPISLYDAFATNHADGARVHSDSWGDPSTSSYNTTTVDIDRFCRDYEDDLVLFAVINGTSGLVMNPENAKNALAVGASWDAPNQGLHSSGRMGPTADGRRKPEVYAPGLSTVSAAAGTSCGTVSNSGTSMACPAVAGMGLLARQYFADGFYPSGRANPADAFTPSGALLKAVLIHSAVDMTGVTGYPSDREGWGRLLLDNALFFAGDSRGLWIVDKRNAAGLTTGQQDSYSVLNLGTTQRLNVTLCFTDVPGAVNSLAPVVNNLDLEVDEPAGGAIYKGNVFDTTAGQSMSGGGFDAINNVEQVQRASPVAGAYTIKVTGAAVNGPSGNPRQGYALVVSGDVVAPAPELYIGFPNGRPDFVEAGPATNLTVRVQSSLQTMNAGSPTLRYRVLLAGGAFASAAMAAQGNNLYTATLPSAACGESIEYYVTAQGNTSIVTSPTNAPTSVYVAAVQTSATVLADDFEADRGWSVVAGATAGNFERAAPQQTQQCARDAQPGADHTSGAGTLCFVTGAAAGADVNANDLDGGPTRMVSPRMDLSNHTAATVDAYVWFHQGYLPDNTVSFEVSDDDGATWTTASVAKNGRSAWQLVSFRVDGLVHLNSRVRVRLSATDAGVNSTMEVMVDDVIVRGWGCPAAANCLKGDMNADGRVDGEDVPLFVAAIFTVDPGTLPPFQRCAADTDRDGGLSQGDAGAFVTCLLSAAGCP